MKIKVQAQHLQPGDIVGSGEKVVKQYIGYKTPRGKVDVVLQKGDNYRSAYWGKYTEIDVERSNAK